MRQLAFWFGHYGKANPNTVPRQAPPDEKRFPCPWPKAQALENIKRVADYWCGGRGEEAAILPPARFNEILGVVLAKEQAKLIEAEEMANEARRNRDAESMRHASRGQQ